MHLRKPKREFGTEINITPLIDIVFLLIIFSMIVSQFTKLEVEKVDLPEADAGKPPGEMIPGRLVISVHKDGKIVVAGEILSPEALESLIVEAAKESEGRLPVLIRGDRRSHWQHAGRILRICAAQRIDRLKFAVLEEGDSGAEP